MARYKAPLTAFAFIGLLVIAFPDIALGQRGGGRGGGGGGRRTAVIAGIAAGGTIGDGKIGDGVRGEIGDGVIGDGNRPGYIGGGVAHPGLVGAAIARRRVPVGTVIEYLPPDCEMTWVLEMEYYYCSGQYYQPMGTETEPMYVAAEPYIPQY